MEYISAAWHCNICKETSKTAHLPAVSDYFLLWSPTITRKQFADFLQIDSLIKARYLLLALNLLSTGQKRGTKYFLPKNCIFYPLDENSMKKGEFFT
jgi:hypothetical protein